MIPKIVPDVVSGQTIRALPPTATALEAARLMRDHDVSSVVVVDPSGALVGIVTERDLARRVVCEDRLASAVPLAELMTPSPATVAPTDSPYEALETMRRRRFRHLPVVDNGGVVGMVSMRDLRHAIAGASAARRPRGLFGRLRRGGAGR